MEILELDDSRHEQLIHQSPWLASPVRWRPAAESMVFFAGLACPAVDAMKGKPNGVNVDERQQNDDEPDEHAETTEVAISHSGGAQGDEGLEQSAPKSLFRVEVPENDIADSEKDGHEEETDEHGCSVEENRLEQRSGVGVASCLRPSVMR